MSARGAGTTDRRARRAIRPGRVDDCAHLSALALRSKAWWGYPASFMRACREELAVTPDKLGSARFSYYVAEQGDAIVGFYALEALSGERFELEALFVDPPCIGSGAGRELLEHAITVAGAAGARVIEIQSDPQAEPFYRALGAVVVGERPSASVAGRVLPLLELRIDQAGAGVDEAQ